MTNHLVTSYVYPLRCGAAVQNGLQQEICRITGLGKLASFNPLNLGPADVPGSIPGYLRNPRPDR